MTSPTPAPDRHANHWNILESSSLIVWSPSFAVPADAAVLHAWEQQLFAAGERYGVLRVERFDDIGYDRARDGYIGDFAAAHPDLPPEFYVFPAGFILGAGWERLTLATRLAFVVGDDWYQPGDRIEEEWFSSIYDLSDRAKIPTDQTSPPITIYADVEEDTDPRRIIVDIGLWTDIFFPWNPPDTRRQPVRIDNRLLAERNGRRLNAFLADVRAATLAANGTWEAPNKLGADPRRFDEDGIEFEGPRQDSR
ncbi:hypothetical protein [Dactylosporangium darangshiense]|uniref:Uncharacterized protein n=1 Tax=Dactylosporangium darangshiense TaxID=579108 RepID=A0ABP8DMS3_9ACTN